jgi:hypothetical protein
MDHEPDHRIPAANIGDLDLAVLAKTNPGAAEEIARLEDLMHNGLESKEQFRRLCQLLYEVGATDDAEYLLRRNLEFYEGRPLYFQLFGTVKQEEYDRSIEAFQQQFGLTLRLHRSNDFLVSIFHTNGGPPRSAVFALLSQPCEIKIGYIEKDRIEADVVLHDPGRDVFNADENMLLFFVNGVWELD